MIAAPAKVAVEFLKLEPFSSRARKAFDAMQRAARAVDIDVVESQAYVGGSPWLVLWGPGAPNRFPAIEQQISAGGHVVALDLAYWQRDEKFRVSIDAAHPQRWVMRRDWPTDRFDRDRLLLESHWNPDGPVIVAGIGEKATVQYGADVVAAWEADIIRAARADGRIVLYRPKRNRVAPAGVQQTSDAPIDTVLRGASLVVTWHSNVAVDAIRLGIPVVCMDGAAAAVCPSAFMPDLQPLSEYVRRRFLANLAWFQWAPSEAESMWRWLLELLG